MTNFEILKEQVAKFPLSPGVYLMKDNQNEVLYVGKAKQLKKRVQSYLRSQNTSKVELLMSHVNTIEYLITSSDYEALLLEHNLIKEHHPKYNILLRDDKTFPMIKITKEEYPRVLKTRTIKNDGGEYFGPYIEVSLLNTYLDLIEKSFSLRKCRKITKRENPCLYYHLGRCTAICAGLTTKKEYLERVKKIRSLLNRNTNSLKKEITLQMHEHAQQKQFEQAARCRDTIYSIDSIERNQIMIDHNNQYRNVIGIYSSSNQCCIIVVHLKEGRVIDQHTHYLTTFDSITDTLEQFLLTYYHAKELFPQVLIISLKPSEEIELFFQENNSVIQIPQSSADVALMRFAKENAKYSLQRHLQQIGNKSAVLQLQHTLNLAEPPMRIEGFDIATMAGNYTNAALVSFYNGVPDKSQYRHFSIKSLQKGQVDDFQSLQEAVSRRYSKLKNEKKSMPNLILIDGGLGQVNSVKKILDLLELDIPVIGLAKKHEEIFFPGKLKKSLTKKTPTEHTKELPNPLQIPLDTPASQLLQAVRDEAHRFGTTFRANKQLGDLQLNEYLEIPGIGPKKSKKISELFSDHQAILDIPVDTLANILHIPLETANNLHKFCLNKQEK